MSVSCKHSVILRYKREHMARPPEILRLCPVFKYLEGCDRSFCCGYSCSSVHMIHRYSECSFMIVCVSCDHLMKIKPVCKLSAHRHAYESFSMDSHEVYVLRGGKFACAYEVSLIFSVLIVCHYYYLSLSEILKRLFYSVEFKHLLSSLYLKS